MHLFTMLLKRAFVEKLLRPSRCKSTRAMRPHNLLGSAGDQGFTTLDICQLAQWLQTATCGRVSRGFARCSRVFGKPNGFSARCRSMAYRGSLMSPLGHTWPRASLRP